GSWTLRDGRQQARIPRRDGPCVAERTAVLYASDAVVPDPHPGRVGVGRDDARPRGRRCARPTLSRRGRLFLAADHAALPGAPAGRGSPAARAGDVPRPRSDWVLSGSLDSWGAEIVPSFD